MSLTTSSTPLRFDRLTKDFGKTRAVDELTFEVPEGQVTAFLGPNGAGKTTTIETLMNLHRPSDGLVEVLMFSCSFPFFMTGLVLASISPMRPGSIHRIRPLEPSQRLLSRVLWCLVFLGLPVMLMEGIFVSASGFDAEITTAAMFQRLLFAMIAWLTVASIAWLTGSIWKAIAVLLGPYIIFVGISLFPVSLPYNSLANGPRDFGISLLHPFSSYIGTTFPIIAVWIVYLCKRKKNQPGWSLLLIPSVAGWFLGVFLSPFYSRVITKTLNFVVQDRELAEKVIVEWQPKKSLTIYSGFDISVPGIESEISTLRSFGIQNGKPQIAWGINRKLFSAGNDFLVMPTSAVGRIESLNSDTILSLATGSTNQMGSQATYPTTAEMKRLCDGLGTNTYIRELGSHDPQFDLIGEVESETIRDAIVDSKISHRGKLIATLNLYQFQEPEILPCDGREHILHGLGKAKVSKISRTADGWDIKLHWQRPERLCSRKYIKLPTFLFALRFPEAEGSIATLSYSKNQQLERYNRGSLVPKNRITLRLKKSRDHSSTPPVLASETHGVVFSDPSIGVADSNFLRRAELIVIEAKYIGQIDKEETFDSIAVGPLTGSHHFSNFGKTSQASAEVIEKLIENLRHLPESASDEETRRFLYQLSRLRETRTSDKEPTDITNVIQSVGEKHRPLLIKTISGDPHLAVALPETFFRESDRDWIMSHLKSGKLEQFALDRGWLDDRKILEAMVSRKHGSFSMKVWNKASDMGIEEARKFKTRNFYQQIRISPLSWSEQSSKRDPEFDEEIRSDVATQLQKSWADSQPHRQWLTAYSTLPSAALGRLGDETKLRDDLERLLDISDGRFPDELEIDHLIDKHVEVCRHSFSNPGKIEEESNIETLRSWLDAIWEYEDATLTFRLLTP